MSKSDAQRRSYLADQMTMGERVEALERQLDELINEDIQQLSDDAHDSRRRIGKLEKASNPGMTHFVGDDCAGGHRASPTECGRIVADASEWDRLQRIREAALAIVPLIDAITLKSERDFDLAQALLEAFKR